MLALALWLMAAPVEAAEPEMVQTVAPLPAPAGVLAGLELFRLDGAPFATTELSGKVVLFVNVASKCGLTPQYEGLQKLYAEKKDKGLVIVGVPSNQFMGQEPGSAQEIATFCKANYGVDFPILEKQDVNGKGRSELYKRLVASPAGDGKDISWNFEKFVVGRDGAVSARFSPRTVPDDAALRAEIDKALGKAGS